ncbi:MAG: hypothetical protein QXO15_12890 [Nitrososphaerota archaeon]
MPEYISALVILNRFTFLFAPFRRVLCPKCGLIGYLVRKKTVSRGYSYNYWYVEHKWGGGVKWCYIGRLNEGEKIHKLFGKAWKGAIGRMKAEKGVSVTIGDSNREPYISLLLPKAPLKIPSILIHKMRGK